MRGDLHTRRPCKGRALTRQAAPDRSPALTLAPVFLVALLAALLPGPSVAHDFWIEPSTFKPALGDTVDLALRVGEGFVGEPVGRNAAAIERFLLVAPGATRSIGGVEGMDPAGRVRVVGAGLQVVAYQSRPTPIELEAGKFESYLAAEGLEHVIATRRASGSSGSPGREVYSRCAKAILEVVDPGLAGTAMPFDGSAADGPSAGDPWSGAVASRPAGLNLELIPEKSPLSARDDESVPFRLTYDGQALEGALVVALHEGRPDLTRARRTNAAGRAAFELPGRGPWLVKAVHMVPATARDDADWESFWASLTFARGVGVKPE